MGGLERLIANRHGLTPFVGTGATIAVLPGNPHASWAGLLEQGLRRCQELGLSTEWAEFTAARLRSGDLITYLAVADEISRRLDGFGEWNDWVDRTVGRIKSPGSAMHAAICQLNRIVLTTNYDLLLEEAASTHKTVHWQEIQEIRHVINEERRHAVIHLHGVAKIPKSVVLGSWQYQALRDNFTAQFWTRVLLSRRLLFIGCGSGLSDPNIGPALEFVQLRLSPPPMMQPVGNPGEQWDEPDEHYILVRGSDLSAALKEFGGSNIVPVAYGAHYSDLARFLTELADDDKEPTPSQNVHDYLNPPRSTPKQGLLDLAGPAEEALQMALDAARRALQALGQVERRSTLPYGVDRWAYADQLFIHERTAASVIGPIERLQGEAAALALAIQDADAPMGLLTAQHEQSLGGLFMLVDELAALCSDLSKRITKCINQVTAHSKLTDDYRPAVDALREVKSLADDIQGTLDSLPRA